jgi:hypothetical protein
MKKLMIADLIKAAEKETQNDRDLAIQAEMDRSNVDEAVSAYLVDNWSSETDRDQVLQAAEDLGLDPQDISDNDVEAINEAGSAKGSIDTSMGIVKYIYNHPIQAYSILLLIDGVELMYNNIDPNMMKQMINAESAGIYYNENLRKNDSFEGCGCKANPCEDTDTAIFSSIS